MSLGSTVSKHDDPTLFECWPSTQPALGKNAHQVSPRDQRRQTNAEIPSERGAHGGRRTHVLWYGGWSPRIHVMLMCCHKLMAGEGDRSLIIVDRTQSAIFKPKVSIIEILSTGERSTGALQIGFFKGELQYFIIYCLFGVSSIKGIPYFVSFDHGGGFLNDFTTIWLIGLFPATSSLWIVVARHLFRTVKK